MNQICITDADILDTESIFVVLHSQKIVYIHKRSAFHGS